jgi:hypothetical protein
MPDARSARAVLAPKVIYEQVVDVLALSPASVSIDDLFLIDDIAGT